MSDEKTTQELLQENSFIEVQDWLLSLDGVPIDAHFDAETGVEKTLGLKVTNAALLFTQTYFGTCKFMNDIKRQFHRTGSLSPRQCRAALKIMQEDLRKGKMVIAREGDKLPAAPLVVPAEVREAVAPAPRQAYVPRTPTGCEYKDEDQGYVSRCNTCFLWFKSFEDVMIHANVVHDETGRYTTDPALQRPVIKDAETSVVDISGLPDGRYAIPHPAQVSGYVFFTVKTIKKRTHRSKAYRWSKYHVGHEWIEAGTIEVREWSQDAKRLCGEQKPGQGYCGEYIDQLVAVLQAPKAYGLLFSAMIGCCSVCGKTLTDDTSRRMGIGPECYDKWGTEYWENWDRRVAVAAAQATAAQTP